MAIIKATSNYRAIVQAKAQGFRGIVLPGGTRSSKTVSALQWIILYCLQNTGKTIAICRDTMSNLKRTTLADFEAICYGYKGHLHPLHPNLHINKGDWKCNINGNTIWFFGLKDDPMRAYGFESDIFYINEVVSTYKNTHDQLEQRCNDFWIADCNPSEPQSWVYQLELRPDVKFFRTTFLDNPFLEPKLITKILSYEDTPINRENGTADPRKWSIYGKGLVHKGPEIIYPNWRTYEDDPEGYDHIFLGVDWGINHPTACIQVIVDENDLYVKEVVYGSNLDIEEIIEPILAHPLVIEGDIYAVCDNSEQRSIKTLVKHGIRAFAVKKPPGSVIDGIRKIQNMNIFIHQDSHNIQKEANAYKFKYDDKTDTVLDVPIKENDDAWDAIRYPLITFL